MDSTVLLIFILVYLAKDLALYEQMLEEEERIELVEVTLDEVRRGLKTHAFNDAKTAIGLQALLSHLEG